MFPLVSDLAARGVPVTVSCWVPNDTQEATQPRAA